MCEIYDDGERAELCDCCGGWIARGERYLRFDGMNDGYFFAGRGHIACEEARKEFAKAHDGAGISLDSLLEHLRDCMDDEPESKERWAPMLAAIEARGEATAAGGATP